MIFKQILKNGPILGLKFFEPKTYEKRFLILAKRVFVNSRTFFNAKKIKIKKKNNKYTRNEKILKLK